MLSHAAFNVIDTAYVGRLGEAPLAAMGFIFPVMMFIGALGIGLGMGASSVISRAVGQGNLARVRRLTTDSVLLAACSGVVFLAVGLGTMDYVFPLLGAEGEVLGYIRSYMTIWYAGTAMLMVPMVGNNAIRASGDTFWPSAIMVLAATVNLLLDPLLIFGWFGLPRMGIAGAALATVIARAASVCASLALLAYRKRMLVLAVPSIREVLDSWRRVLQIGLPAAASTLLYPITMAVITRLVSGYGDSAVAAVGAGGRIEGFAMMVLWATSTILTPFVGQNWGAGRHGRVRRAQMLTGAFSVVWGLACWAALAASSWWIGRLFSPEPEVIRHLTAYLWIVPAGYGLRGVCVLANASLNALHRPWRSALLNVVRLLGLYIPLAWLGGWIGGYPWLLGGISVANVLAGLFATALVAMPLSDAPQEGDLDEASPDLVRKSA